MRNTLRNTLCAAAALAMGGLAAPAVAQVVVQELTVMGRVGVDGELKELSRVVSYADLDLRTEAGQDALRSRIRATAEELCQALDEPQYQTGSVVPSCENDAVQNAMGQFETAVAQARSGPAYAAAPPPPEAAPVPPPAPAAPSYATSASVTTSTVTNGPVPDTPENRRRFGQPLSNAGKRTAPVGN